MGGGVGDKGLLIGFKTQGTFKKYANSPTLLLLLLNIIQEENYKISNEIS